MKKTLIIALFLLVSIFVFAEKVPISGVIVDSQDVRYELDNVLMTSARGTQYWTVLGCYRGESGFSLELSKIQQLVFVGKESEIRNWHRLAEVMLTNSNETSLLISVGGSSNRLMITGTDTFLDQHIKIPLNKIKSITFSTDVEVKKCPTTGKIFTNPEYRYSPYTGERLIAVE